MALVVDMARDLAVTVRGVVEEGEEDHAHLEEVAVVGSEVASESLKDEVEAIEGIMKFERCPSAIYIGMYCTCAILYYHIDVFRMLVGHHNQCGIVPICSPFAVQI